MLDCVTLFQNFNVLKGEHVQEIRASVAWTELLSLWLAGLTVDRSCRSSWNSCRCRRTTSRMNRRTSRRNTYTHRRRWSGYRVCRSSLASSWRLLIRTTASWDQQQVETVLITPAEPLEQNCCRHSLLSSVESCIHCAPPRLTRALSDIAICSSVCPTAQATGTKPAA